jgi:hypothetical protein
MKGFYNRTAPLNARGSSGYASRVALYYVQMYEYVGFIGGIWTRGNAAFLFEVTRGWRQHVRSDRDLLLFGQSKM